MRAKDDRPGPDVELVARRLPVFVDRGSEVRRLDQAIRKRENLMICGPAGIGKTALVSEVIHRLTSDLAARCLYLRGMKDLQDLLRQLVRRLHDLKDRNLRHQLHDEGISALTFEAWLKGQSSSRLKGTLYRTLECGDYRVFLDHFPPMTKTVAKVVKELFWMRHTPVYLLVRDEGTHRIDRLCRFFYWGERERFALPPLPAEAAAELLLACIERFGLARFELSDFKQEVLELSRHIPGAIVKMCMIAADPRYQYESRIKIKSVYIDYLMNTTPFAGRAVSLSESEEDGMN
jgi:DNA polymerase III delta prime subunit